MAASSGGGSSSGGGEEPVAEPHQAAVGALPPAAHRLRRPRGRPDAMVTVQRGSVGPATAARCPTLGRALRSSKGLPSRLGLHFGPLHILLTPSTLSTAADLVRLCSGLSRTVCVASGPKLETLLGFFSYFTSFPNAHSDVRSYGSLP